MNTLDEAAREYTEQAYNESSVLTWEILEGIVEKAFKAGALWMAKQHADEISECTEKSFKSGAEFMKQQFIEWLNNHFDINVYEEIGGRKAAEILTYDFKSIDDMIEEVKKL